MDLPGRNAVGGARSGRAGEIVGRGARLSLMTRSPETWRHIVRVCGAAGLLLAIAGYAMLQDAGRFYRAPSLLAFYGGFALIIAAILLWYRHVPPRPPAEEELEPIEERDNPDHE